MILMSVWAVRRGQAATHKDGGLRAQIMTYMQAVSSSSSGEVKATTSQN